MESTRHDGGDGGKEEVAADDAVGAAETESAGEAAESAKSTVSKAESKAESKSSAEAKAESSAEAESTAEREPAESKAEPKAESKTEPKAESKTEPKAESKTEPKAGTKAAAKGSPEPAPAPAPAPKDSKKLRNAAIVGGALVVAGFATGFAGGFISGPGIGTESGEPRTLEQLTAALDCKPVVHANKDFRQGNCQTKRGKFVVLAFTTEKGKQTWLKLAKDYGGMFLVGTRWVIAGTGTDNVTKPMLDEFRGELGGQIQPGRKHHGGGGNPHVP